MINQISLAACMDLNGACNPMQTVSKQQASRSSVRLMQSNQGPAVSPSEAYDFTFDKWLGSQQHKQLRSRQLQKQAQGGIRTHAPRCPADHQRRNRCNMYSSATACQAGRTRTVPVMAHFASSGA